jgi:hypothetical protein
MEILRLLGRWELRLFNDEMFETNSNDDIHSYEHVYGAENSRYRGTTRHGVNTCEDGVPISSALLLGTEGVTGVHERSLHVENCTAYICVSSAVFALSIPRLALEWELKVDDATNFGVYALDEDLIIHGELSISRISRAGQLTWQEYGSDIFVTAEGKDDFYIREGLIHAKSWDGRKYVFDLDGKER